MIGYSFLIQVIGDFTSSSRSSFPYSLAAKDKQTIFSPDCVPEGFTLSDPDHLTGFKITALYNHWLGRQAKRLQPFIVLNASPNHWVSTTKTSEDRKGKGKMKYVEIDDDADEEGPGESDGDKELPPAVKIGPPKHKGKKIPTSTHNSGQVPEDSMLFAPIPGPSTLTRSKQSPKKKISKRKQPDVIARPTDKPVTRSSSRPGLTKKIVVSDEASYIARTDQGHKRSRRDGDKQLVDTVSKFFEAW